jgi:hypothetical protein
MRPEISHVWALRLVREKSQIVLVNSPIVHAKVCHHSDPGSVVDLSCFSWQDFQLLTSAAFSSRELSWESESADLLTEEEAIRHLLGKE